MNDERVFDEIKLSEVYGEMCGLFKRADEVDPEYDYTYMISINAEVMSPELEVITKAVGELCEKFDIDGSVEGLFFEPGYGVAYDTLEINFDQDDEQVAVEFAEELFSAIQK